MPSPAPRTFDAPFDRPEDAAGSWTHDPMHFPHPLPPLSQDMMLNVFLTAFGYRGTFVQGYLFTEGAGPPPPTEEVLARGAVTIWNEDFVPSITAFCRDVRDRDYSGLTAPQLVEALAETTAKSAEQFRYTMIVVFPFMGPTLGLMGFSEQVLGAEGPMLVASVLQAATNDSALAGEGLGDLIALAATSAELRDAVSSGDLNQIRASAGGPAFMAAFERYLSEYGWRVDDWSLMHKPTWAENPQVPLRMLSLYAGDPERSPAKAMERSQAQRKAAEAELQRRLPAEARPQFEGMLAAASQHVPMSESRARWQLTLAGVLRIPAIALGHKLVEAGALAEANDVFYLSLDELRAVAASPTPATKELVTARKQELAGQLKLQAPPFLGVPPSMEDMPPEAQAVMTRFFGFGVTPSTEARIIKGNAASKGTVTGRARVIRTLDQSDLLQPGEILVCGLTAAPWTPLFAIAGGVVTDTGGILSHSAICAREYAIPCVVGTQVGTRQIPDGALISVNGDTGIVEILG